MSKLKYIFISLLVIVVVILELSPATTHAVTESGFTKQELKDMKKVDKNIAKVSSSEEYNNGTLKDKKLLMKDCLTQLKKKKLISTYHYDKDSKMFSYTYKCGVLGGVMLVDFDPMFN